MNWNTAALALCMSLLLPVPSLAQNCNDTISASTPIDRFLVNDAAVVVDKKSGLQWQRCSEGQVWQHGKCYGEALQFSWAEAQQQVAKRIGWRLPTLKELADLVELSCAHPAINLRLFPDTPGRHYWTATKFASAQTMHWQVQFATGDSHNVKDIMQGALRLVSESNQPSVRMSREIESPAIAQ